MSFTCIRDLRNVTVPLASIPSCTDPDKHIKATQGKNILLTGLPRCQPTV